MTTVTQSEILLPVNGAVPILDSPAAPAPAGARLPVTQRVGKWKLVVARSAARWWAWTARPSSLAATWRLSRVDPKRIPAGSGGLRGLWLLSNGTDRLVWFALMLVAPSGLQGPLRFLAVRPTRRLGFYLVAAVLSVAFALGKG